MHRKMTRLARALKCGGFGASGLALASASARSWARAANARYPNPDPAVFSRARREIIGGSVIRSFAVLELGAGEERLGERGPDFPLHPEGWHPVLGRGGPVLRQEVARGRRLLLGRRPAVEQLVRRGDPLRVGLAGLHHP